MGDIISAQKVVFGYPKEDNELNIVLRGVSLTIPEGQLVAVLGHNGSGKSTLAKHFNAILVPNEGVVAVSYTHLDVYKRQALETAAGHSNIRRRILIVKRGYFHEY